MIKNRRPLFEAAVVFREAVELLAAFLDVAEFERGELQAIVEQVADKSALIIDDSPLLHDQHGHHDARYEGDDIQSILAVPPCARRFGCPGTVIHRQ